MEVVVAILVLLLLGGAVTYFARRPSESGARPTGPHDERDAPTSEAESRQFLLAEPGGSEPALMGTVVPANDSLLFGADTPQSYETSTAKAWNSLAQAVPTVAQALSRGEVVQVLGPQYLIDGIRAGTFGPTQTASGALGVVKGPDGKFVGHLRFGDPENAAMSPAVAGPLLVFQLASAVTMQYYLHQITSRLVAIEQGINEVKTILHAQTAAGIRTAQTMCTELERITLAGQPLTEADVGKLQAAETEVRNSYFALREQLVTFNSEVFHAVSEDGTIEDRDALERLLKGPGSDAAKIALRALEAMATRIRLGRLRSLAEVSAAPERAKLVQANIEKELDDLREDFESFRAGFDRLNVRCAVMEDKWAWGAPRDELYSYRADTKRLRALLRTPTRRALPAPEPQPYLIELRQGEAGMESRYALIEAGSSS